MEYLGDNKYEEVMNVIVDSGFSRIPVFKESFDQIQGILYVKDLLPHLEKESNFNWQRLLRDAFFVPENKKINDLLQEFQEKKIHLTARYMGRHVEGWIDGKKILEGRIPADHPGAARGRIALWAFETWAEFDNVRVTRHDLDWQLAKPWRLALDYDRRESFFEVAGFEQGLRTDD